MAGSCKCRWCPATYSEQHEVARHEESKWLHYPERLAAAERVVDAARKVQRIGSFSNRCGATLSPELDEALAAYDAGAGRESGGSGR